MATLQRSTISYRRDGSSGAVWGEKLLPELVLDNGKIDPNELRHCYSVGGPEMMHNNSSSSSESAAVTSTVYTRSSSLSVSALKLLHPKSFGQKFKGVLGRPPTTYGKTKIGRA